MLNVDSVGAVMKMRIAQVCPRYHPYVGGVETHVRAVSERLVKKGLEIDVLTTDLNGDLVKEENIEGVKVRRFGCWAPSEAYYFSGSLKNFLAKHSNEYDIVHAHGYNAFPALYAKQTKSEKAFVFTPHYLGKGQTFFRNLLHIPYRFIGKGIFNEADSVICVSEYERLLVKEDFAVEEGKVLVIPNGVDKNELSEFQWKPNFSQPKITFSGRLERRQKNVDKLIYAFDLLVKEYNIDAKFVIIGRGPYENEMVRLIERLGLQERLEWRRWLPRRQYLEELATSNVFVAPSEHECYGIAAAEAIALGIPTVVANSTALAEFVEKELAFSISLPIIPSTIAKSIHKALIEARPKQSVSPNAIMSWDVVADQLLEKVYKDYG